MGLDYGDQLAVTSSPVRLAGAVIAILSIIIIAIALGYIWISAGFLPPFGNGEAGRAKIVGVTSSRVVAILMMVAAAFAIIAAGICLLPYNSTYPLPPGITCGVISLIFALAAIAVGVVILRWHWLQGKEARQVSTSNPSGTASGQGTFKVLDATPPLEVHEHAAPLPPEAYVHVGLVPPPPEAYAQVDAAHWRPP
jgi:vacuolar-type H+-ATPase subunit I/STV1